MKLTEEQRVFAEENHNLIYSFANSMNLNLDEYYDVLAIGFCKSITSYNSTRGKFSTYSYICMRNELFQVYRKENKYLTDLPLDREYQSNHMKENEELQLDIINAANIKSLINTATDLEKEIVRLRLLGMSQAKISKHLGMSQSQVSRAINKLKFKYDEMRNVYD